MCPCGCGAIEVGQCWEQSDWLTTCEFCNEPSMDGVCPRCAAGIALYHDEAGNYIGE